MDITNHNPYMDSDKLLIQLRQEFDSRVQKAVRVCKEKLTPCDFWIGTTCSAWASVDKGHGKLQTDIAKIFNLHYAHHISMFLNDPEEFAKRDGRDMLHACDVPYCVNREHLRWGTEAENVDDREKAGRGNFAGKVGTMNNNASLSQEDIKYIIDNPGLQIKQIAEHLGVERHTISHCLDGTSGYLTSEQRSQILESRKMSKIDITIVADLNAGMTDVDIAKKHSIHRKLVPVIKARAIEAGIEVIDHEEVLKEQIVEAIKAGKKLVKIAEELGISRNYVNKLKEQAGLKPKFERLDIKGKKKSPTN
jgi:plasmid maintenance system antidote protein VapI